MKKIKVYIQYPWKVSDSQYYKNMIAYPPENARYISDIKSVGMITNKTKFMFFNLTKRFLRKILELSNLPIVNAWETKSSEFDIIHCAHCLSKNKNVPWVADFEMPWQFWVSGRDTKAGRKMVRKVLLQESCKKLIAWTEQAKADLIKIFPEIKDKVEVVSHALPSPKNTKSKHKQITILFSARYFYLKGGLHALEAIDRLTKKYENVFAYFISEIPAEIKKRYENNKKIKFFGLMPYEKVVKGIYPKIDLMIYPGYSDSFGFTFTEALAFGIPVVTVDGYARKSIIQNGKTGFIIPRPKQLNYNKIGETEEKLIDNLVAKASLLIETKRLREKMSKNCTNEVKNGKFSLKERNKRLRRIYEEALS